MKSDRLRKRLLNQVPHPVLALIIATATAASWAAARRRTQRVATAGRSEPSADLSHVAGATRSSRRRDIRRRRGRVTEQRSSSWAGYRDPHLVRHARQADRAHQRELRAARPTRPARAAAFTKPGRIDRAVEMTTPPAPPAAPPPMLIWRPDVGRRHHAWRLHIPHVDVIIIIMDQIACLCVKCCDNNPQTKSISIKCSAPCEVWASFFLAAPCDMFVAIQLLLHENLSKTITTAPMTVHSVTFGAEQPQSFLL